MEYYKDNTYRIDAIALVIRHNQPYYCTDELYRTAFKEKLLESRDDNFWIDQNNLQLLLDKLKIEMDADELTTDIRALFEE